MPILSQDIKLLASERLTDNPDGGGRITGNEIVDGQSNNLFPDISDLDRTYGRVSLRKAFVGVRTDDTDVYYGGHLIVDEAPTDPLVGVSLFTTEDWVDERIAARDRIESYVVQSTLSQMRLLEDQLEGARQILAYQSTDAPLPDIGEVLVLSTESGANAGEVQFVRITEVQSAEQTFIDSQGSFVREVLTIGIGSALRFRFYGHAAQRQTAEQPATLVRTSTVAAISRYYATTTLAEAAALGDTTVRVGSVYTPIVPASRAETPVVDVRAAGDLAQVVPAAEAALTIDAGVGDWDAAVYVGRPIVPGSLVVERDGGSWGYTDDAAGQVLDTAGALVGRVDYEQGKVTAVGSHSAAGTTFTFTPGAVVTGITWTAEQAVTLGTRGYNYTFNLRPIPWLGTLLVDYRAQGQWYRLRENGAGELVADDDGAGTGTVNFVTGSIIVTLGALPDVDTAIIAYWGSKAQYGFVPGSIPRPVEVRHSFDEAFRLDTFSMAWDVGGTPFTATVADPVGGYPGIPAYYKYRPSMLTGDAVGSIATVADGTGGLDTELTFIPDAFPAAGTSFAYDFDLAAASNSEQLAPSGGALSTTLTGPLTPGSISIAVPAAGTPVVTDPDPDYSYYTGQRIRTLSIRDDGQGNLVGDVAPGGSIDYDTGALNGQPTLTEGVQVQGVHSASDGFDLSDYAAATVTFSPTGADATINYDVTTAPGANATPAIPLDEIVLQLNPAGISDLIPNSVAFTFNGSLYVDRDGLLYRDIDHATGAGVLSGSLDYATGLATLTNWTGGANSLVIHAVGLVFRPPVQSRMVFRTPGAPVRPASTFVRANEADGTLVSDTCDQNGAFGAVPDPIGGDVDQEVGIVRLSFLNPVLPGTVFYNTVIYSFLPLDPDILGLDPVRLPQDGRVPAFQPADVAVVHHTQRDAYADLAAGQVLDAARTRLAAAKIVDSEGTRLDPAPYTEDLDAGTITLDTPLDLAAYTAPYEFVHRIEDMLVVSDVQINGYITCNRAVSHDFPITETLVSSALITGDLQARYANLFEQETWTGVFSDQIIGDSPDAAYNDTTYPIAVTNRGALTERWALVFTGSTSFDIVGDNIGQIGVGDLTSAAAPTNPNSGVPYFTIDPLGWGQGWGVGNVLRFNTFGADYPLWIARTVLQGTASGDRDDFRIQIRGNANTP